MSRLTTSPDAARKRGGIQRFFAEDVEPFCRRLAELEAEIDPAAAPMHDDAHHRRVLQAFQQSQVACRRFEDEHQADSAVVLDVQERFRKATEPWFGLSWIAHRARSKPSGFAGDYEMLIKLYDEATPACGLGGYLDLCILDLPLARAVRSRLAGARRFLIQEIESRRTDVRILDIACGPCREYLDWPIRDGTQSIEIVAMDSDPKALEYIDTHVAKNLTGSTKLRAVRYNAFRTRSAAATVRKFGKFDILYSVGLCDYLSDEHLVTMLAAWRETLNDGGMLYVAFKDTERYDQTPYQWHLDWFFFQRTLDDVLRLYTGAGFDVEAIGTSRDATGIIVNFLHRRPLRRLTRADGAGGVVGHLADSQVSGDTNTSSQQRESL
jgi:extracellular factor (EF) 3-hydroxypalmitic acid methyl ester biosynthesis protein